MDLSKTRRLVAVGCALMFAYGCFLGASQAVIERVGVSLGLDLAGIGALVSLQFLPAAAFIQVLAGNHPGSVVFAHPVHQFLRFRGGRRIGEHGGDVVDGSLLLYGFREREDGEKHNHAQEQANQFFHGHSFQNDRTNQMCCFPPYS